MHRNIFKGFMDEFEKCASKYALNLLRESAKAAAKPVVNKPEPIKKTVEGLRKYFFKGSPSARKAVAGTHADRLRKKFIDIKDIKNVQ